MSNDLELEIIKSMDYGQYCRALANPNHPIHWAMAYDEHDDFNNVEQCETHEEMIRRLENRQNMLNNVKQKKERVAKAYEKHIESQKNKKVKPAAKKITIEDKIKAKESKKAKKAEDEKLKEEIENCDTIQS